MSYRHLTALFVLAAAVPLFRGTASAQAAAPARDSTQPEVTETSSGLKDYLARTFQIQGSVRARFESTQGDFSLTPADAYVLTRIRLGLAFQPTPWLRFYGEAADARAEFYKAIPAAGIDDPFDLRQAFVEIGAIEGRGVRVRVGREDVTLGSGRLIAVGDWGNDAKTFEIAHGTINLRAFKMDLMAGSPVLIDPGRFDRHKPGEHFYVSYATLGKLLPGATVEPYFMAKTQLGMKGKDSVVGNADTLYFGVRVNGKLKSGFDYNFESVREGGSYANDRIEAWGYAAGGGWTISQAGWKPHLNSDYVQASGDSGKKDGYHQGFDCLYGLNQPLNSMPGIVSWHNVRDWRAGVDFYPVKKVKIKVDFRDYWLATNQDGLYNASGVRTVLNTKATSTHIGEGVDAQMILSLNSKTILGLGLGKIAPGSFLTQSGKTNGMFYPSVYFTRSF
jgi:Alginate export